jgi:putative endonuclease
MDGEGKPLGRQGEEIAREALRRAGYRIIEQNYRCPLGELDLVARHGKALVFVEVKSESPRSRVQAKDRVDRRKRRKLEQMAQFFLKEKRLVGVSARFDVVQVRFQTGLPPLVEIIPNAFELQE